MLTPHGYPVLEWLQSVSGLRRPRFSARMQRYLYLGQRLQNLLRQGVRRLRFSGGCQRFTARCNWGIGAIRSVVLLKSARVSHQPRSPARRLRQASGHCLGRESRADGRSTPYAPTAVSGEGVTQRQQRGLPLGQPGFVLFARKFGRLSLSAYGRSSELGYGVRPF